MGEARGKALCWVYAAVVVCSALGYTVGAAAQETPDDAAAREHFQRGREAFEATEYEEALVEFRDAYRLSGRGQLQYNIAVTADRLRRDEEALEAFEHYLEETENPSREQEVQKRITALRQAIEQRAIEQQKERERALAEAAMRYEAAASLEDLPNPKIPKSAIVGSSLLAAAGVAGVVAMGVGLAQNGSCLDENAQGVCVSQRTASPWTGVYGGVGIAALAGSAVWLAVGSKRMKDKRTTAWRLTPTGVVVSGSF